jgi:hypothetical protein
VKSVLHFSGGGYFKGAVVRRGNNLYESVIDNNTSNDPEFSSVDIPTWIDLGKINRWRMFDEFANTHTHGHASINGGDIRKVIAGDGVTFVFVSVLEATDVTVERLDASLDIIDTISESVENKERVLIDIGDPLLIEERLRVIISNDGEVAKCSILTLGKNEENFGKTQWEPESKAMDSSLKQTDDYGRTFLRQRGYADILTARLIVDNDKYDEVGRALRKFRAQSYIWDFNEGDTDYNSLLIYGFYRDHSRILHGSTFSTMKIEIQEFT